MPPGRDPHLNAIRQALAGHLDKDVFERCLGDLLRPDLPGLVPVLGGKDGGWDGAFLDEDSQQCPLIVTAAKDYGRNLSKSLETLRSKPHPPKGVAFATSQHLSTDALKKLTSLAKKKGFERIQVFDREAIADRLYHSGRWTRELLCLSGAPSVLGRVPRGRRAQAQLEILGREEDIAWLQSLKPGSDYLLVGEPGSGKSYLLAKAIGAERFDALFVLRSDAAEAELANALRDQRPPFLIVDDAHADLAVLDRLRGIREEGVHEFSILATTWPGREADVREALGGVTRAAERRLELLPRRDIVKLLRALGVDATVPADFCEQVLGELADQAANRPGLAVTLGRLWMNGGAEDRESLWRGEGLRDHLVTSLKQLVGEDVTALLACLALAGETGGRLEAVADFLCISRADADRFLNDLAAAGVVASCRESHLKVLPRSLRAPLVAQKFFPQSGPRQDPGELIERLTDLPQVLVTLAQAAIYGAAVPSELLRTLAVSCTAPDAWRALASVSSGESRWVLENYPGPLQDVAGQTLQQSPEVTIELLLQRADPAQAEEGLEPVLEWLGGAEPRPPDHLEILRRRRIAVDVAMQVIAARASAQSARVAWRVFVAALDPSIRSSSIPTADKSGVITSFRGHLPSSTVHSLTALWDSMRIHLQDFPPNLWSRLARILDWYVSPHSLRAIPEEDKTAWQSLATRILDDFTFLELPLGLRIGVSRLGESLGRPPDPLVPMAFGDLFPDLGEDWEAETSLETRIIEQWIERGATEVVAELRQLQSAADYLGRGSSPRLLRLLSLAAEASPDPEAWLAAMAEAPVPPDWDVGFVTRLLKVKPPGWEGWLRKLLEIEWMAPAAAFCTLQDENAPPAILERAFEVVRGGCEGIAEQLVERRRLPTPFIQRFLEVDDPISSRIAIALWSSAPRAIPAELRQAWERALLARTPRNRYQFQQILAEDPSVARQWLLQRLEGLEDFSEIELLRAAVTGLTERDRRRLLQDLTDASPSELVPLLVGRDSSRFRLLLAGSLAPWRKAEALQHPHRYDTDTEPALDSTWKMLVEVGSSAGLAPEVLLAGTLPRSAFFSGFGVEYWTRWRLAFSAFLDDRSPAAREVARLGVEETGQRIAAAREEERRHALEGFA